MAFLSVASARSWAGLVVGLVVFAHEALTTKNPVVLTASGALMGIPIAFPGRGTS